jgi:outer membrane protein assembly factor BamB
MRILPCLFVAAVLAPAARGDDWPQWLGPRRDSVWRETGILDKFPEGGPKVLWRAPAAYGYAGPAVAGGKVYLTDFVTDKDVTGDPSRRGRVDGRERVRCLDAATGQVLWTHDYPCRYEISYPAGPRCTPTAAGGKVYTLGAMGDLVCLDAEKGTVVWARDLKKDYSVKAPQWGFAGHPLVDGPRLVCLVGGEGSVAVAFDKDTGKEVWRALSAKEPGYCSPILVEAGGKRQVVIWHSESINGVDAETGRAYWSVPLKPMYGMSIATPRRLGDRLFAGGMGGQAVLLKLAADRPAVEVVWRGEPETAVYPSNSTPFLEDGVIYGVGSLKGELQAVKVEDGKHLWETPAPAAGKRAIYGTAFLVKNGDRFFLFNEKGDLVIARLSPKGYEEVSRAHLLEPTGSAMSRSVVWSHPAFAQRCVFARNDKEIVCASLAAAQK